MNDLEMTVERADVDDAKEMLDLQKLAYHEEAKIYEDFTIPPLTQTIDEIRDDLNAQTFLKTVSDGIIVGSVRAFMDKGSCYIGRLIVHPDFQNQGIGTRLMNEIETCFKEANRFELFTGHRSERNIHIYEKLGYEVFKTEKVTDDLTLLYMEKRSA